VAGFVVTAAWATAARAQSPAGTSPFPASVYYGRPVIASTPTFTSIRLQTSVTVPDGGTATLGGYNRLSEGRTQSGAPVGGRLPYAGRGLGNVGYGRSAARGRVNVSARIIILREEEFRQTGYRSP
jgi:hypothetical protein